MLGQLSLFVVLAGVTIFVAWLAGTGRVMYVLVMLWVAAAFGFAVLDLVDYEIVKRERRN
jgi:amino acid transporter